MMAVLRCFSVLFSFRKEKLSEDVNNIQFTTNFLTLFDPECTEKKSCCTKDRNLGDCYDIAPFSCRDSLASFGSSVHQIPCDSSTRVIKSYCHFNRTLIAATLVDAYFSSDADGSTRLKDLSPGKAC